MKSNGVRSVQGIIVHARTRRAASGSYAHEFTIGRKTYTLFNDEEDALLKAGDLVEFDYIARKGRSRSRHAYSSIEEASIRLLNSVEEASGAGGYVYVLTNRSMPGLCKIGFTTGVPAERAAELSASTGVPTPFKLEWFTPITGKPELVERSVHVFLSRARHGKEFFKLEVERAKAAILQCYGSLYPRQNPDKNTETFAARNRELAAKRDAKLKHLEEARRQREYEQSPEFMWLRKGHVFVVERAFPSGFTRQSPGFWERLFGNAPPSWIGTRIGLGGSGPV